MNLFKKYYPVVKRELKKYGGLPALTVIETPGPRQPCDIREYREKLDAFKWNMLICKYVDMCDEEERKFIDLLYFKNNPIGDVGIIFPLSTRTCQEWREELLKNLVLLAAREGLIDIESALYK